jgi:hypothetical protein
MRRIILIVVFSMFAIVSSFGQPDVRNHRFLDYKNDSVLLPLNKTNLLLFYTGTGCSACFKFISQYFLTCGKYRHTQFSIIFSYNADAFARRSDIQFAKRNFPEFLPLFDSTENSLAEYLAIGRTPVIVKVCESGKWEKFDENRIFTDSEIFSFSKPFRKMLAKLR